eukprot:Rhum_TRINITY_DN23169_c0_g1::Rhum_TRINITY_DN23169_c0_g1_i1::g.177326::m.177326
MYIFCYSKITTSKSLLDFNGVVDAGDEVPRREEADCASHQHNDGREHDAHDEVDCEGEGSQVQGLDAVVRCPEHVVRAHARGTDHRLPPPPVVLVHKLVVQVHDSRLRHQDGHHQRNDGQVGKDDVDLTNPQLRHDHIELHQHCHEGHHTRHKDSSRPGEDPVLRRDLACDALVGNGRLNLGALEGSRGADDDKRQGDTPPLQQEQHPVPCRDTHGTRLADDEALTETPQEEHKPGEEQGRQNGCTPLLAAEHHLDAAAHVAVGQRKHAEDDEHDAEGSAPLVGGCQPLPPEQDRHHAHAEKLHPGPDEDRKAVRVVGRTEDVAVHKLPANLLLHLLLVLRVVAVEVKVQCAHDDERNDHRQAGDEQQRVLDRVDRVVCGERRVVRLAHVVVPPVLPRRRLVLNPPHAVAVGDLGGAACAHEAGRVAAVALAANGPVLNLGREARHVHLLLRLQLRVVVVLNREGDVVERQEHRGVRAVAHGYSERDAAEVAQALDRGVRVLLQPLLVGPRLLTAPLDPRAQRLVALVLLRRVNIQVLEGEPHPVLLLDHLAKPLRLLRRHRHQRLALSAGHVHTRLVLHRQEAYDRALQFLASQDLPDVRRQQVRVRESLEVRRRRLRVAGLDPVQVERDHGTGALHGVDGGVVAVLADGDVQLNVGRHVVRARRAHKVCRGQHHRQQMRAESHRHCTPTPCRSFFSDSRPTTAQGQCPDRFANEVQIL